MQSLVIPFLGIILLNVHFTNQQLSGSGSIDDAEDRTTALPNRRPDIFSGSGDLPSRGPFHSTTSTSTTLISDDEDEDDVLVFGSGGFPTTSRSGLTDSPLLAGSGAGGDTDSTDDKEDAAIEELGSGMSTAAAVLHHRKCREHYCWCVDDQGIEIEGTMSYTGDGSKELDCRMTSQSTTLLPTTTTATTTTTTTTTTTSATTPSTTTKSTTTAPVMEPAVEELSNPTDTIVETDAPDVVIELSTTSRTSSAPKVPPYVVNTQEPKDITPKFDPATPKDPAVDGSGKSGNRKGDDDVDRQPAHPGSSYLTHPGILAIIIGGGVVALLSAMLLIMFIVYRMRKKDEGSYPLDSDSNPPRMNAYSNTNKEYYL